MNGMKIIDKYFGGCIFNPDNVDSSYDVFED